MSKNKFDIEQKLPDISIINTVKLDSSYDNELSGHKLLLLCSNIFRSMTGLGILVIPHVISLVI